MTAFAGNVRAGLVAGALGLGLAVPTLRGDEVQFRRGDVNVDGVVDSGDVFFFDPFLHDLWIRSFACADAADVNDSGAIDITDMVMLLSFLFLGGPEPTAPGPVVPGPDPTPDSLECESYDVRPLEPTDDVTLGFEGPLVLAGAELPFRGVVFATLAIEHADTALMGWSVRVELQGEGLRLVGASTEGTAAAPAPEGRLHEGFSVAELLPPEEGSGPSVAAMSTTLLSLLTPAELPSGSTERILRLAVESSRPPEPPDADQALGTLAYVDGPQPSGVVLRNVVHGYRRARLPRLEDGEISLRLADAWQLPGDCSQDGRLDVSDAICLLSLLFLGQGDPPCGGEDAGSGEIDAGSIAVLDSNGDGEVNVSDAVRVLGFLFLGTEPPPLGSRCIPISGCPSVCR